MSALPPIRVLLVDDVDGLREIYRYILRRSLVEFEVVGEACDGEMAIRQASALQPDVILLDISMPVMDGLEALPHIRRVSPSSRVVMLTGFEAGKLAEDALRLGAVGYLEKGATPTEIVAALVRVAQPHSPRLQPTDFDAISGASR